MLEAAIRDEIRGRMLLTDAVRERGAARPRDGARVVTLLDEGGIDDLDEPTRDRVLSRLAEAVAGSTPTGSSLARRPRARPSR